MEQINYIDLALQFEQEAEFLQPEIDRVLRSGMHVGGPEVEAFEREVADYIGSEHAIGVGSGTDALILAMKAYGIGPGDEVITPPNSFATSTSSIVAVGATPVFADVCEDELLDPNAVRQAITPRTRAIMPVHLRGGMCDMEKLKVIADKHELIVIEDAAQAIGSAWQGIKAGAIGDIGCFSAHPLKVLNAIGDAGFVTTDDPEIAGRIRRLRNAGLKDRDTVAEWSGVSRLDPIQATVLRARLKRIEQTIQRRRFIADAYLTAFSTLAGMTLPLERPDETRVYNTFTIQCHDRDGLQQHLSDAGIQAFVHYPTPLNRQPAASNLSINNPTPVADSLAERILSLPVHQHLRDSEVTRIIEAILAFFAASGETQRARIMHSQAGR